MQALHWLPLALDLLMSLALSTKVSVKLRGCDQRVQIAANPNNGVTLSAQTQLRHGIHRKTRNLEQTKIKFATATEPLAGSGYPVLEPATNKLQSKWTASLMLVVPCF